MINVLSIVGCHFQPIKSDHRYRQRVHTCLAFVCVELFGQLSDTLAVLVLIEGRFIFLPLGNSSAPAEADTLILDGRGDVSARPNQCRLLVGRHSLGDKPAAV